ncbi:MAG TPA: RtcB family protein [Pseudonocardiaceae bacterium]|nr:RtcB family protein [Pseudonocardiaceae bacterium]
MKQINNRLMNWASILEPNTLAHVEKTASMPFIHPHLALMPDAHLGKSGTVGAVIPTLGAIIPAAVGGDIGCVDAETEYLSPTGWRKISEYDGGKVMEYSAASGHGRFVTPEAYIVKPCPEFYGLHTEYGIDQMLSPDHRVLCWKITGPDRRRVQTVMTAEEFAAEHKGLAQGFNAEFATTFAPALDTKLGLSDDELRVQVMVHADAHLEPDRAGLRLSNPRKIERARELLRDAGIAFTESTVSDGTTHVRFAAPMRTKSFAEFWPASAEQLAVIADECLRWDGDEDHCYFTRDHASADFIQYAFTATGHRAVLRADEHPGGATDYRVFAHDNAMVSMAGAPKKPITVEPGVDGKAYCFTVPTGCWVMRRGGNVVMTGNCGMVAVKTQSFEADFRDNPRPLSELREAIERAIPLSKHGYNTELTESAAERVEWLAKRAVEQFGSTPGKYAPNWELQLGSLGTGNHFIEVTVDEDGQVWLFLHSGSRDIGKRIAEHHITVAQKQCERRFVDLPDPDLAYLVEGDGEFWSYMNELSWAQEFALLNREEMMDRVLACVTDWLDQHVQVTEEINCHHNYTVRETHFGESVWVTRKGAIEAAEGVPGLIPSSMGTPSYVVEGKGNRLALNSAPHGAGRNVSRRAARDTFSHEQLREAMRGIEYRDTAAFIDEIPAAYKDIDQVMADAADLVEVRHTLRQIVNVKGD